MNPSAKERAVGVNAELSSTAKRLKEVNRELAKLYTTTARMHVRTHIKETFDQAAWRVVAEADKRQGLNSEKQHKAIVAVMESAVAEVRGECEAAIGKLAAAEVKIAELKAELKEARQAV